MTRPTDGDLSITRGDRPYSYGMGTPPKDPQSRPGRLRVGVVGAGRVGTVLGAALARAGHTVVGATAVSASSVNRVHHRLPGVPLMPADEIVQAAELVLIAVPDDVIADLVLGLDQTNAWRKGQLVAHVSGAHGLDVLAPAVRAGAIPLAIHPVMAFTGRDEDSDRIVGISYGVTAPALARPMAEALVVEMGGEPVWIANDLRPLYHAALTVSSNYVTALLAEGADLLRAAGVQRPDVMLGPLVGASVDNGLRFGDAGLTGPIVRGDAATVAAHIATLRLNVPDAVEAYIAMARRTADRAIASGRLTPADAEPLLEVLAAQYLFSEND